MSVMRISRQRLAAASATAVTALALGAVSVLPATAAAPAGRAQEGVIQNAGASDVVKDSYIITLRDSADAGSAEGKALAAEYGAKIKKTYETALNGYAVTLSETQAKKFAADPDVVSVAQNRVFTVNTTQPNPPSWGLDRLDQRNLPLNSSYTYPDNAGQGVTAYIIDTGVRISHNDFGTRASNGYDAIDNDNVAQDGHGHGTHVAATVAGMSYGVAKQANIVGVRVLNDLGSGTTAQIVAGIDWVTANAVKPAVANMSLGGSVDTALDTAVRNSIASGVTYTVAAGNSNINADNVSPARVSEAITVGSTTSTDARSSFSNHGSTLDLFAPGTLITSAWNGNEADTNTISGTSMAAPHAAGAAVLHLAANPTATPAQVSAALTSGATTGVVRSPGTGSPNRLLHVTGGTTTPPGPRFENLNDYTISDNSTVESPVTVIGIPGNAPSPLSVPVDIKHTYIGDLRIDLVAPDNTVYNLKGYGSGGSSGSLLTTYSVNASAEAANGTWKLRVSDNAADDVGKLDSWALQF